MDFQSVFQLCDQFERLTASKTTTSKSTDDLNTISAPLFCGSSSLDLPRTCPLARKSRCVSDDSGIDNLCTSDDISDELNINLQIDDEILCPAWEGAPAEILLKVFEYLDPLSIINAAKTCKRWRGIITDTQSLQWRKMKEYSLDVEQQPEDDDFDSMSVDADSDDGKGPEMRGRAGGRRVSRGFACFMRRVPLN